MDKSWIEKKIIELKNKFCSNANITVPPSYAQKNTFSGTEAQVNLDRWKNNEFTLTIYPSFFKISKKNAEFVLAHEIMHIKDIISNDFGYDGSLRGYNGCDRIANLENTIWEISIDMRLEKMGYAKIQEYNERVSEYINTHWPQYKNRFTLDINDLAEVINNPTCGGIKSLAERKNNDWIEYLTNKN